MKVSIVIPCYNYALFLSRAIRSALDQTMPRDQYEIIVVDDGSEDETRSVMQSYGDTIRPIYFDRNCGLSYARNEAIRIALGRFIVCLDADDYLDSNLLFVESLFLTRNAEWDAVSCDYFLVDDKEDHIARVSGFEHPIACGVMFRKEQLIRIGLYDSSFRAREEEDLRIRFLHHFRIHHIPLPLYRYRRHERNLTNDHEAMSEHRSMLEMKHADCDRQDGWRANEMGAFPVAQGNASADRAPITRTRLRD